MSEATQYGAAFPKGSRVRVADRATLEAFMAEWKFHHKLNPDQLAYADCETMVEKVGFYHGGDPVYELKGIPGSWLEQCLRA